MKNKKTLEEAAKDYIDHITLLEFGKSYNAPHRIKSFIAGAKWQAKRMYSEADLREAYSASDEGFVGFDFWFEQFKKKKQ